MKVLLMRYATIAAFAVLSLCGSGPSHAQQRDYPNRPVVLVVPFAAGGAADVLMRALTPHLSRRLGQSFIVENRSGANGSIGTAYVANAAADGYTLLATSNATLGANPAVYKKLSYDAEKDFTPIAPIGVMPAALVINKEIAAANLPELLALLRAKQQNFSFGSPGVGNPSHLAGERFKRRFDVEMEHVPYRGGSEIMRDLIAGNLQMAFSPLIECLPHVRAGSICAIVGMRPVRTSHLPELPSIAELGAPDIAYVSWQAIHAPKATPPHVVKILNDAINAILREPEVRELLNRIVIEPMPMDLAEFAAFEAADRRKAIDVAAEAGVRLE